MLPAIAIAASAILGHRTIDAVRITTAPPVIDGRLDESVWSTAPVAADFVQSSPRPATLASLKSEARVLMDDDALYIGLTYYDPDPRNIQAPLARRDDETTSDWAFVEIDSRFDRRSGFSFGVNPAGVQVDGTWSNDANYDSSWNAVWEAAAKVNGDGWTAEVRIPFSQLAFRLPPGARELTWGINFYRYSPSHGESSNWSPRYRALGGVVSHFNDLQLPAPPSVHRLEVTPYAASQRAEGSTSQRAQGSTQRAGADFRVGLGSNFSLTGTVKPDFGQVEADPSQVNLSAFELFQAEQRPFFLEGADVFQMPTGISFATRETSFADESPFYSRRIGRSGDIGAAAKLSGQTSDWTVGLFTSSTRDDSRNGALEQATVARAIHGDTGFFFANQGDASIGGADIRHRFDGGRYEWRTWALASRDGSGRGGASGEAHLTRRSGNLTWDLIGRAVSPRFDMNTLGFQRNADWLLLAGTWRYDRSRPGRTIRNWTIGSNSLGAGWTWHGQPRNRVADFYGTIDTNHYWTMTLRATHELASSSTTWLRGGPTLRLPPRTALSFSVVTDQRRPTYASLDAQVSREELDGSHAASLTPLLNVRSSKHLQWSIGTTVEKDVVGWQYVGHLGNDYIVGRVHQDTVAFTVRGDYIFTPQLSLQWYAQPFRSRGRYDAFQRLTTPNTFTPIDFSTTGLASPDGYEHLRNEDVVLRWEYRPGSFFTAVWTNDRVTNIVLVKVSRRFGA
jgi:hypothetical protein